MKLGCKRRKARAEKGKGEKVLDRVGWTRSKHFLTWVTQEWKEGQRGEGGRGGAAEGLNQHVGGAALSMAAEAESIGSFGDASSNQDCRGCDNWFLRQEMLHAAVILALVR